MNDDQKTKEQSLDELAQGRALLERAEERSLALQEVSKRVAAAHDTDEVLDLIVNEAARLLHTDAAYIRLLEGETLVIRANTDSVANYLAESTNRPEVEVAEGTSNAGHVLATKKPLVMEDAATNEIIPYEQRLKLAAHGFHGRASVPLLANDRSIGVLSVTDKSIRRFTEDEVSLLSAFADQAALALEKARLLSEAERERERADSLYRVSNLLAGAHDTDEVLDLIVNEASRLLGAANIGLRLIEGNSLVIRAVIGSDDFVRIVSEAVSTFDIDEQDSRSSRVMATQQPLFGDDGAQAMHPEGRRLLVEEQGWDPAASGSVPLLANGKSIGTPTV